MKKGTCTICGQDAGYGRLMCSDCLRDFDFSEYKAEVDYATFDPDDSKVRIYSDRVAEELFAALATLGFQRAYRQGCFFGAWDPAKEDAALALCGEITDEDTTLTERAEDRAARFATYAGNAQQRARSAREAETNITKYIPLGQPILVGHHSEKRHRRDLERVQRLADKQVEEFRRGDYWKQRAAGVTRHAERKYNPQTVRNRIKKLESRLRKVEKETKRAREFLRLWGESETYEQAKRVANHCGIHAKFPADEYPRKEGQHVYEGTMSLWSALDDGIVDAEQAKAIAIPCYWRTIEQNGRWAEHLGGQIEYWRSFLQDEHGEDIDVQRTIKKGQWVQLVWWNRPTWGQVVRINRSRETKRITTVTVDRATMRGSSHYTNKFPYDDIKTILDHEPTGAELWQGCESPKAQTQKPPDPEVEAAREAQRAAREIKPQEVVVNRKKVNIAPEAIKVILSMEWSENGGKFSGVITQQLDRTLYAKVNKGLEALGGKWDRKAKAHLFDSDPRLKLDALEDEGSVMVEGNFDLFLTPPDLARRMIDEAQIGTDRDGTVRGMRVLEPSAGTGRILEEICKHMQAAVIDWCEIDHRLRVHLETQGYSPAVAHDFMEYEPGAIYDRILMNPPFSKRQDVRHVLHAWDLLRPGGRIVAIMSEGPFFRGNELEIQFRALLDENGWSEELPDGTFRDEGTMVKTRLVVMDKPR